MKDSSQYQTNLEDIFRDFGNVVIIIKDNYNFNYLNRLGMNLLGYNESEILEMSFIELLTPDSLESCIDNIRLLRETYFCQPFIINMLKKNAEILSLELSGVKLDDGRFFFTGRNLSLEGLRKEKEDVTRSEDLSRQIKRTVDVREKINHIIETIIPLNTIPEILDKLSFGLRKELGYERGAIFLVKDDKKNVSLEKLFSSINTKSEMNAAREKIIKSIEKGKGLTTKVFRTNKSKIVNDVEKEKNILRIFPDTKSEMIVPIKIQDKTTGVITIDSNNKNGFDETDLRFVEILTNSVAIMIEKSKSYEALLKRSRYLSTLYETSQTPQRVKQGKTNYEKILKHISQNLTDCTTLILRFNDTNISNIIASSNATEEVKRIFSRISDRNKQIIIDKIKNANPFIVDDIKQKRTTLFRELYKKNIRALYIFPFFSEDRTIGCLILLSHEPSMLSKDQISFLTVMTNQLSSSSPQLNFYESLNSLSQRLSTINTIDKLSREINEFIKKNFSHLFYGLFLIKDSKFLEFKAGIKWGISPGTQFEISKRGVIGWAVKMKAELFIKDITEDNRKLERNGGIKSIYAVPLLRGNDILGVAVFGLKQQKRWDKSDLTLLRSLSRVIGVAISNAIFASKENNYSKKIDNLNQYINTITNGFPSGIITIDKKGTITLINKKAQEILGFSENAAKKLTIKELFDYKHATVNPLLKTIRENKPLTRIETYIVENDGKKVPIGFSTSLLMDESGIVIGVIGIMRELTEIKEMEERLRRQDRLVALGEMAAGMAHEIRNPLAGIKTGVEYLGRLLDENKRGSVDLIIKEINRLNRIVSDMTLYANRPPIKFDNIKIEDIIDISLAFLRNEIEEKGIEVIKKFDNRVSILRLDSDQMREVFDNIILNAIQAAKDNGKIIISTNLLEKEKKIEVKFTDNGVGISEEDQERIFNPFFTTKKGGTGLGLSISHRIISEHNGYISIESKQGKGSTMKIVLSINP